MITHSIFGPSSAHRWLRCPGSIKAEASVPEKESPYAVEGSAAHALAETCLKNKNDTNVWIGKKLLYNNKEWIIDPEMADYIQMYIDYVREIDGDLEIEQKVSYNDWVSGGSGTADAIVVKDDILFVIDLKYGKGVKVDAKRNPQGQLYALGALSERAVFQKFKKVIIIIHQPRLEHVSEWETTPDDLYSFGHWAKGRAQLCIEPNPERVPGDKQCQWCKAKAVCPALSKQTEMVISNQFNDLDEKTIKAPEILSDDQLQFIMSNKKLIESWLKSVEAYVKERIEDGNGFPGWKLVHGRSTRKWNDEEKAERLLRRLLGATDAYKKTLLTPPAAEKALGKEKKHRIDKLIFKPEGAPVLVSESDKRLPMRLRVTADDF